MLSFCLKSQLSIDYSAEQKKNVWHLLVIENTYYTFFLVLIFSSSSSFCSWFLSWKIWDLYENVLSPQYFVIFVAIFFTKVKKTDYPISNTNLPSIFWHKNCRKEWIGVSQCPTSSVNLVCLYDTGVKVDVRGFYLECRWYGLSLLWPDKTGDCLNISRDSRTEYRKIKCEFFLL